MVSFPAPGMPMSFTQSFPAVLLWPSLTTLSCQNMGSCLKSMSNSFRSALSSTLSDATSNCCWISLHVIQSRQSPLRLSFTLHHACRACPLASCPNVLDMVFRYVVTVSQGLFSISRRSCDAVVLSRQSLNSTRSCPSGIPGWIVLRIFQYSFHCLWNSGKCITVP